MLIMTSQLSPSQPLREQRRWGRPISWVKCMTLQRRPLPRWAGSYARSALSTDSWRYVSGRIFVAKMRGSRAHRSEVGRCNQKSRHDLRLMPS